ncbi:MAG: hypothetical protein ABEH59_11645 [Halobacteriales archaeon]
MADRAVSTVLSYVLALGVITLLMSGLFLAGGTFVENEHERVIRSELEVLGNRVAADIAAVDRLALAAGSSGRAELETDLPARVAGKSYTISISPLSGTSDVYFINMTAPDFGTDVEVRVKSSTPLVERETSGGDVRVVFNGTHVEVRDA